MTEVIVIRGGLQDDVAGRATVAGHTLIRDAAETAAAFEARVMAAASWADVPSAVIGGLPDE